MVVPFLDATSTTGELSQNLLSQPLVLVRELLSKHKPDPQPNKPDPQPNKPDPQPNKPDLLLWLLASLWLLAGLLGFLLRPELSAELSFWLLGGFAAGAWLLAGLWLLERFLGFSI